MRRKEAKSEMLGGDKEHMDSSLAQCLVSSPRSNNKGHGMTIPKNFRQAYNTPKMADAINRKYGALTRKTWKLVDSKPEIKPRPLL